MIMFSWMEMVMKDEQSVKPVLECVCVRERERDSEQVSDCDWSPVLHPDSA